MSVEKFFRIQVSPPIGINVVVDNFKVYDLTLKEKLNSHLPPDSKRPRVYEVGNINGKKATLTVPPKTKIEEIQLNYFPDSKELGDEIIKTLQSLQGYTVEITDESGLS